MSSKYRKRLIYPNRGEVSFSGQEKPSGDYEENAYDKWMKSGPMNLDSFKELLYGNKESNDENNKSIDNIVKENKMARYVNKGPVMNLHKNRNQQSTWNTTQGPEGGRKSLPSKWSGTGGELLPATFAETGTTEKDFDMTPEASLYEMNQGIDPSKFDVSDPEQVMAFQRQAGLKEDAMFGPKTQEKWEEYVNSRRQREGKDQFLINAQGNEYGGGKPRSLIDAIGPTGKYGKSEEDEKRILEQVERVDEETGGYENDNSLQGGWGRLGSSLKDTATGWGDWFQNQWNRDE